MSLWVGGEDQELLDQIHKVCDTTKKGEKMLNMTWKYVHSRVHHTVGDAYQATTDCPKMVSWACSTAKQYMFGKGILEMTSTAANAD